MTEPTHDRLFDADAETREVLDIVSRWLELDKPDEAVAALRRELGWAWDLGERAGWRNSVAQGGQYRANPWLRRPASPAPEGAGDTRDESDAIS